MTAARAIMTPPTTPSIAARFTASLQFSPLAVALALALPLGGCGHSDFPVAVGNRTANTVSVFANGDKIGEVNSNLTATFTLEESPTGQTTIDSAGSPTSPRPVVQVTFTARDMTTGMLSAGAAAILVNDVTTYVDVAPCSLLSGRSDLPCVAVSTATTGSQAPACTFSLSPSGQSFTTIGGAGTVNVNASSGCTWSATSNASWITVTSGSSATGSGVVAFRVDPNNTGQARTASLSIAGQTFTINQTA